MTDLAAFDVRARMCVCACVCKNVYVCIFPNYNLFSQILKGSALLSMYQSLDIYIFDNQNHFKPVSS